MTAKLKGILPANAWIFSVPLLLALLSFVFAKSTLYQANHVQLSLGLTLDFVVTIPLIYFLLIRKREIPKITVASVFILSLIAASLILPAGDQAFLSAIKVFAIPAVELCIFTFVVLTARKTIRAYRENSAATLDFYTAIHTACQRALPGKIADVLAMEIAVVYYALFVWRAKKPTAQAFTYHRKSGVKELIGAAIFIVLIETIATHILVGLWSHTVAWVLTALSAYACLQLWALSKSTTQRYITLEHDRLVLRYGFFGEVCIPLSSIERLELSSKSIPDNSGMIPLSPLGMLASHNVLLYLKDEHTLHGIYGIKKTFTAMAFFVDDKEDFAQRINVKIAA